jgi:GNAT superfamily N-acetyltransferase
VAEERDHLTEGERREEKLGAPEPHSLRELEERVRFEQELHPIGKPLDLPKDGVALRRVSDSAIADEGAQFRIQRGNKDVGRLDVTYERSTGVATIDDFKILDPNERGRGTGTLALRQAEVDARSHGMHEMRGELSKVDTDLGDVPCQPAREKLADFYRKRGYEYEPVAGERSAIFGVVRKSL